MRRRHAIGIINLALIGLATTPVVAESLQLVEMRLIEMSTRVKTVKASMRIEDRLQIGNQLLPRRRTGTYEGARLNGITKSRETLEIVIGGGGRWTPPRNPADKGAKKKDDYLDYGYTPAKSDFALGYLLNGAINTVMGRDEEASDNYKEAATLNEDLVLLIERLRSKRYNTLLIVDWGSGPEKIAFGPDGVFSRFRPLVPSDDASLAVSLNGAEVIESPIVCDLNEMAQDHMWNNMEDVRLAKSAIGNSLVAAGAGAMAQAQNWQQQMGALIVIGIGAAVKASARADTRYCESMPQRVYLVPVNVEKRGSKLTLEIEGKPESKMVFCGIDPPAAPNPVQVKYIRLPERESLWAAAERIIYGNDSWPDRVGGDDLPYILGGRCVRRPSEQVLAQYQAAGNLTGMTLAQLEGLYRAEGIKLSLQEEGGRAGLHVLEGGSSLECPMPGSAGFKRLFCQEHLSYVPRSQQVKDLTVRFQQRSATSKVALLAPQEP